MGRRRRAWGIGMLMLSFITLMGVSMPATYAAAAPSPGACGYVIYNLDGTPHAAPGLPFCNPPCPGVFSGPGRVGNDVPRVDYFLCVIPP